MSYTLLRKRSTLLLEAHDNSSTRQTARQSYDSEGILSDVPENFHLDLLEGYNETSSSGYQEGSKDFRSGDTYVDRFEGLFHPIRSKRRNDTENLDLEMCLMDLEETEKRRVEMMQAIENKQPSLHKQRAKKMCFDDMTTSDQVEAPIEGIYSGQEAFANQKRYVP
jgi:hypothetical protein